MPEENLPGQPDDDLPEVDLFDADALDGPAVDSEPPNDHPGGKSVVKNVGLLVGLVAVLVTLAVLGGRFLWTQAWTAAGDWFGFAFTGWKGGETIRDKAKSDASNHVETFAQFIAAQNRTSRQAWDFRDEWFSNQHQLYKAETGEDLGWVHSVTVLEGKTKIVAGAKGEYTAVGQVVKHTFVGEACFIVVVQFSDPSPRVTESQCPG